LLAGVRTAAARLAMSRHRCNALPLPAALGDAVAKLRRIVGMNKEKGEKRRSFAEKTQNIWSFPKKCLSLQRQSNCFGYAAECGE